MMIHLIRLSLQFYALPMRGPGRGTDERGGIIADSSATAPFCPTRPMAAESLAKKQSERAIELDIDRKMKKNHDREDILILYQKIISA
jgi:hypothetical protein